MSMLWVSTFRDRRALPSLSSLGNLLTWKWCHGWGSQAKARKKTALICSVHHPTSPQPLIIQPGKHVQTGLPHAWPAQSCKCVLICLEGENKGSKGAPGSNPQQPLEPFLPGMYQIQSLQSMCEPEISQSFQFCSQLQPGLPLRSSY